VSILERCDRAAAVALANVSRIHLRRMSPLALFGAIARRHVGPSVDVKSASGFDDLILVYALKVEREYGSIKSFCTCFCCVRKFGLGAPFVLFYVSVTTLYQGYVFSTTASKNASPAVRVHVRCYMYMYRYMHM